MNEADIAPAVLHGEQRLAGNHGEESMKFRRPNSSSPRFPNQRMPASSQRISDVSMWLTICSTSIISDLANPSNPPIQSRPDTPANPALLPRQPHQLLGEDVKRQLRWIDRLDISFFPSWMIAAD